MPLSAGGLPLATSESQQRIHVRPEHVLSVSSSSSVGGGDVSVEHHPIRRHPSPPKKYPHHPHLHSTSGTSSGSSYHHHHHHAQHNAHTMMTQQPSIEDFGYTSPRLLLHQQSQAGSAVTSTMSKTNFKSSKTSGQSGFAGGRMVRVRPVTPPIIPAPISTVQDPKHTKFLKWQAREAVRKHYAKHAESDSSSPQTTAPPPHQPHGEATSVSFTSIDARDTCGIVAVVVAPPAESSPSLPIALPSQRTASPASSSSSSSHDNNDGGQRRLARRRTSDEKQLEKEKEKRRRAALDKIPFVPHVKTEYLERTFYTDIRNTVALSTMKLQRCRSAGMSLAGGGPAPPQPSARSDDDHHQQHEPPIRDEPASSIRGANEASAAVPRLQGATARAKPPALPRPMSTRGTAHYEQPPPAAALNTTVTSLISHVPPSMTAIPQPLQTYTASFEYQSTFLDRFNSRPSSAQHQSPQPSAHHQSQSNTMSVVTSTATTPRPQSSSASPAPGDLLTDERLLGVNTSPTEDPRAEPNRPARPPQHFFITQNPPVINPQQPSSLPAIVTVNHTANNAAAQSLAALQDDALDPWVTALAPFEARDALLLAFRPGCTVERSKYAPPASRALRLEQLFKTLSCADEAFLDRVHYRSQDTDSRRKKVHASLRSVTGDIQERGDDGPFQHQLFKRLMAQDAREFYVNGAVEVERWYADREHLSDLKSAALERKLDMTKVVNTTTTHDHYGEKEIFGPNNNVQHFADRAPPPQPSQPPAASATTRGRTEAGHDESCQHYNNTDRYGEKEIFGPNNNVQHFAHRAPPPQPSQPPAASATTRGMSARPASAAKQATVENLLLDVRRDIGKQLQKSHKEERSSLQRIFIHAFCKKISVDCFGGPGRLTTAASTILDTLTKDVFLRQKPISAQSVLEWVQSIPADALFLHDVISICISLCSGLMMPISMWLVPLREKLQFAVATKAMVPLPDSADDVGWLLVVKPSEWGPRCIQWVCSLGFEKLMMERVARGNGKGRHELLDDELDGGGETASSPLHNNRSLRDAIIQHLTAVPRQSFLKAMMPIVESMAARTSPPPSNIRNAASGRKPNHQTFPLQRRGSMVMTSVPPTIRRAPSVASSVTSLRATVAPLPTATVVVTAVVGPQRPPQLQPPVVHQRSPGSTHHPTPPETPMMLPLVLSDPLLLTSTNLRQQQQQSAAAAQSNDPMMMSTISDQQLLSSSTSISLSPPQGAPQQQHLSGQQQGRQPHSRHNSVSNPLSAGTPWSPDSAVTPPPATAATTAVQTQRRLSRRQYAGLKLPKYAVELLQKYNAAPGGPSVVAQTASSARLERHMSDAS
ncbi:Hypothetical protein, putative [Bodo saltans]|uniref:Uncharacterized protein n=1 Tax=Bodo saltans TaxID=75058 RepID=A0A0S4IP69_BODSA|nr:Hypothetical protein, putative [Bodo saltans]|eukprot:CUE72809.1 Hypothetical protein, putative [Bodo saltans]